MNYDGGPQLGAFQKGLFVYGGGFPMLYANSALLEEARDQDNDEFKGELFSDFTEESEKYKPEFIPALIPTIEESMEQSVMITDMNSYVTESRRKFVTGEWNFEKDWDAYVEQMDKMGSSRYAEIKQAQYDRYKQG